MNSPSYRNISTNDHGFSAVQHCGRLFCSCHLPSSLVITESLSSTQLSIFTNRNNSIAFKMPHFLQIWLSSAKGFNSSGLEPARYQLHYLLGSMSLFSRGRQAGIQEQQPQKEPLQMSGCFYPFTGVKGEVWPPLTKNRWCNQGSISSW